MVYKIQFFCQKIKILIDSIIHLTLKDEQCTNRNSHRYLNCSEF